LSSPSYLIAGLEDGSFMGMDLSTRNIDLLKAHQGGVTQFLIH
jgi:hypothetical protein